MAASRRFPDPHDLSAIPGTEGWEEMYPPHLVFNKSVPELERYEDSQFWFIDSMHAPDALTPFDVTAFDMWRLALAQAANKIYAIPPTRGVDQRILNGYIYVSAIKVEDPAEVEQREHMFHERAGFYFANWDDLFAKWTVKMDDVMAELEAIEFLDLPEMEPESSVFEAHGYGRTYPLLSNFLKLWDNRYRAWQYHFEMNNLVYGVIVTYKATMQQLFPGIADSAIGKTFAGFDSKLFRPTEELQKLAQRAVELQVTDHLLHATTWAEAQARLAQVEAGREWLEDFEAARHPWFEMAVGTGWYHTDLAWNERLDVPFSYIKSYVMALADGKTISRPRDIIDQERKAVTAGYRALIDDEKDLQVFDQLNGLACKVAPFSEDHHFYCEHWEHSVFYRKMRDLGQILVNHGVLADREDFVYLTQYEIQQVLYDVCSAWALGTKPHSAYVWPSKVERRKEIFQRLQEWTAPPALGPAPDEITEPITIVMWGVTSQTIENWLSATDAAGQGEVNELRGFAAGAGRVEGIARVCRSVDDLLTLEDGEILVAPTTAPTWAPAFHKIRGIVTDIGGVSCHAAIIAREYNLPTVVGTGFGSDIIKTGDEIRVDGDKGVVTILVRASESVGSAVS